MRKVFFSFHFDDDCWRASMVRQMGTLEGNEPVSDNDWETVKHGGDGAIDHWINDQMDGRTCAVILVGQETARRPWVRHEIKTAWKRGMGVVGVRIHGLKNDQGQISTAGPNPFKGFRIDDKPLELIVPLYSPPGGNSKAIYDSIYQNLNRLVEKGISIRNRFS